MRRDEIEVLEARRAHEPGQLGAVQEVGRGHPVRALAEARGGVRLRVEIDDERPLAGLGEAGREVHRSGGLPDPALLVCEREDASGHGMEATQARGRFFAAPGRRGKRSGVGPSFSTTSRRRRSDPGTGTTWARRPATSSAARATCSLVGLPGVEDEASAGRDERQAPLDRDRRRGERPGKRGRVRVAAVAGGVLLGAGADDLHVREVGRPARARNAHLRAFDSSSVTASSGRAAAIGNPGRAAARADVHDRPVGDEVERGKRVVQVDAASLGGVGRCS